MSATESSELLIARLRAVRTWFVPWSPWDRMAATTLCEQAATEIERLRAALVSAQTAAAARNKELESALTVLAMVEAYEAEWDNPAPDLLYRAALRRTMFKALRKQSDGGGWDTRRDAR